MSSAIDAMFERAVAHARAREFDPATAILREVMAQAPDDHRASNLLGQIAHQRNAYDEALALHERALALAGERKDYLVDRALALAQLGKLAAAEADYQRALAIDPDFAPALGNLGRVHALRHQHHAAIELFQRALAIDPTPPALNRNLASSLCEIGQYEEAEKVLRDTLRRAPRYGGLWTVLGNTLSRLARSQEAREALKRAVELDPTSRQAHDNLLFFSHYLDEVSPQELFALHRRYGEIFAPRMTMRPKRSSGDRVRIGYVSPDFNDHAVSRFIGPVMINHDRARFEVFAYHCSPREDSRSTVLRARADHWRSIGHLPPGQAARVIADDRIDILVDLAGHTGNNPLAVLALAPAPVQLTWIGYPNTTGLPQVDYRITDSIADPPGAEALHTEKLLRLPGCFLVFEAFDVPLPPPPSRQAIVFGSFNNAAKISDRALELWARVLDRVADARLLVKAPAFSRATALTRVRARAIAAGIDPARLELMGPAPARDDHLAQYALIDVALDTVPYNGTTTTCEAMWMGVPVVTSRGDRHCARVGASLLGAVGLPELIGDSDDAYVDIAVALAKDRARLAELKAGLRARMAASPLCDSVSFTRRLEAALRAL